MYDKDVPAELENSTSDRGASVAISSKETSKDTMSELFQDQGEEGVTGVSTKYARQDNVGYEIPVRLRTLHNLVIQYTNQPVQVMR